jgi:protein Tex
MGFTTTIDLASVAHALTLPLERVEHVVRLLDAGNTVPFITRYRKDQTGGLDEEQIRQIEARVGRLRLLAERKQTILRSIEGQGKLTPDLAAAIEAANSTKRLEDLYLPFKPKKQSLATVARERKLEPLAQEVLSGLVSAADLDNRAHDFIDPDHQVATAADALLGVGHILAEDFSERAELRERLRRILKRSGKLVSAKTEIAEKQGKEFRDYFEYQEQLSKIPPHRILAINRGEKAKMLRVRIDADAEELQRTADELLVPAEHPHAEFLRGCARDALARLVLPSLEREIRRELTENAETHAVGVFAKNLRNLLLQPPVRGRRVLAVDPGFKSGCKLAVLDEFGNLVDHSVVHLIGKAEKKAEARAKLVELIKTHNVSAAALGNGTACRETEQVLADLVADELKDSGVAYVIVNEAGASVYSTSPIGREEFPNYDATLRGAISIGRRMQDPLSELVKIDPANIGVGLYQHDVKAKHLRTSLDAVVESCVNYVGVDLNTASPALLRYVSGLNQLTARRVYDHRTASGPFKSREQLKEIAGFGEATFVQAAGFLRISDSENPLDGTWIHPESYEVARRVLEKLSCSPAELTKKEAIAELAQKAAALNLDELAVELSVGPLLLRDIVAQLTRPGRDPREDLPAPIFKRGILKLEDLAPGMELFGAVLNVVDFGAFVDIGLHDSGLVHVSQMANHFVRDPHEVMAVGDIVKVWVLEIDKGRRRVSLTMIAPGTRRGEGAAGKHPASQTGHQPEQTGEQRREGRSRRPPRPPIAATAHGTVPAVAADAPSDPAVAASGGQSAAPRPPQHRPRFQRSGGPRPPHGAPQGKPHYRPKPKPAPQIPITEAMKKGKEPLRTFGDLKQFLEIKPQEPEGAEEAGLPSGDGQVTTDE